MGGLGGHMAHLSEDLGLTFNEITDVLGKVARAEIKKVTEKDPENVKSTLKGSPKQQAKKKRYRFFSIT